MLVDIDEIYTSLIKIVGDYVGSELSTTKSGKYAIFRARGEKPEPKYPYVTIDILTTNKLGGYLKARGINQDGYLEYIRDLEFRIMFRVYASDSRSYSICSKLQYAFEFDAVHTYLQASLKASVGFVEDVRMVPDVLPTTQYDSNYFMMGLRVEDSFVDTTSVPIENISSTGTYVS